MRDDEARSKVFGWLRYKDHLSEDDIPDEYRLFLTVRCCKLHA